MDRLVELLTSSEQPVTMDRYASAAEIAAAVHDGVLLLRCTETRGSTELSCEISAHDAEQTAQSIGSALPRFELVGTLTLNDANLRVTASIDSAALSGTARFQQNQQQG